MNALAKALRDRWSESLTGLIHETSGVSLRRFTFTTRRDCIRHWITCLRSVRIGGWFSAVA